MSPIIFNANIIPVVTNEITISSVSTDSKIAIKTDNPGVSANDSFYLKLANGSTNMTVYWGDGNSDVITAWNQPELTHQYASVGTYQISIDGDFHGFNFSNAYVPWSTDHDKVLSIDNWGNNVFGTMDGAFWGCSNMIGTYTDIPDTHLVTSFSDMFHDCFLFNSPVEFDTHAATDMTRMFWNALVFNQPVLFNTPNVTTMESMFRRAEVFNQPINFDGNALTNAMLMFNTCLAFNSPVNIGGTALTNCAGMFTGCGSFNSAVILDTTNVTNMGSMFSSAGAFNQPVLFDTSNVTDMHNMFNGAGAFNQPVPFDTSSVTRMDRMFASATIFNQSVSTFNTSNVTGVYMYGMFAGATAFNQPVPFDTAQVTSMLRMFDGATAFNQSVNFDTSLVTDMKEMFTGSALSILPTFNDTSNVTTMEAMFYACASFDQDISGFDITSLTNANDMFTLSGWTITNYDLLLPAWNAYGTSNVHFSAGTAHYSAGAPTTAKAAMVSRGWVISDGGTP
jgi:hypothetical protein